MWGLLEDLYHAIIEPVIDKKGVNVAQTNEWAPVKRWLCVVLQLCVIWSFSLSWKKLTFVSSENLCWLLIKSCAPVIFVYGAESYVFYNSTKKQKIPGSSTEIWYFATDGWKRTICEFGRGNADLSYALFGWCRKRIWLYFLLPFLCEIAQIFFYKTAWVHLKDAHRLKCLFTFETFR